MTTCIFEPRTDTSSATICKHCGQEKILHNHNIELPQQEISDEEIKEQAIKYDNGAFSETPIVHFIEGAKWYREQLKTK